MRNFLPRPWQKILPGVVLAAGFGLSPATAIAETETYQFDKGHTEIRFSWDHVGLSIQSGEFREYEGTVMWDRENLENSKVDVTIKAASIDTGVPPLDEHLSSADFFDVAKFPEITFKSTSVRQTGVDLGAVTGDLTIHGQTRPVTLEVALNFQGDHPLAPFIEAYAGAPYAAFRASTEILRSDFELGMFAPLTSDRIEIVIQTEMRRQ